MLSATCPGVRGPDSCDSSESGWHRNLFASLYLLVSACELGTESQGHFNPAVTTAVAGPSAGSLHCKLVAILACHG